MNPKTFFTGILLLSLSPALAQQNQSQTGQNQQRQFDPAMQAKIEQYRPLMDLSRTLRMLGEMHKQKGTEISKTQASKLIPIVKDLQGRKEVKPKDADAILIKVEDLLTDKQITWLDKQQMRPPGQGQNGQNGQNRQNGQQGQQGQQGQGQNGQGQNRQNRGPGGMMALMTAANPFKVDPLKTQMADLLTTLQKIK